MCSGLCVGETQSVRAGVRGRPCTVSRHVRCVAAGPACISYICLRTFSIGRSGQRRPGGRGDAPGTPSLRCRCRIRRRQGAVSARRLLAVHGPAQARPWRLRLAPPQRLGCVTLRRLLTLCFIFFSRRSSSFPPVPAPACATRGHQDEDAAAALEATGDAPLRAWMDVQHGHLRIPSLPPVLRPAKVLHRRKPFGRHPSRSHGPPRASRTPLAITTPLYHTTSTRLHQAHSHRTRSTRPRRLAALCPPFRCPSSCQRLRARHHPSRPSSHIRTSHLARFPNPGPPPPAASHARFSILAPHSGAAWAGGATSPSRPRCRWTSTESRGQASFVLYVGLAARPRSSVRPRDGSPKMRLPCELPTHPHPPARPRVPALPPASAAPRPSPSVLEASVSPHPHNYVYT